MDELQNLDLFEDEIHMKSHHNFLLQVVMNEKNHQSVVHLKIHMMDEQNILYLVVKKNQQYTVVGHISLSVQLYENSLVELMLQGVQYELRDLKKNFVMKILRQSAANKNGAGLTRLMMYLNSLFVVPCMQTLKLVDNTSSINLLLHYNNT